MAKARALKGLDFGRARDRGTLVRAIEAQRSDDQGEAYDARSRLHQLLQRTVRGIILAPANKAPDLHGFLPARSAMQR